jgi:hypothetical protein
MPTLCVKVAWSYRNCRISRSAAASTATQPWGKEPTMKAHRFACLAVFIASAAASPWAAAQAGRIQAVPHSPAPATAANTGLPNPAGLNLPVPNGPTPTAIPGATPAGQAGAPTATVNQPLGGSGSGGGVAVVTSGAAGGGTNAMGAGAAYYGRPSPVDVARMFMQADSNHDGELSRLEAQRFGLAMTFDDLDTNHDGVVSRSEFDEAFR